MNSSTKSAISSVIPDVPNPSRAFVQSVPGGPVGPLRFFSDPSQSRISLPSSDPEDQMISPGSSKIPDSMKDTISREDSLNSLSVPLSQALHSGNSEQIDFCLDRGALLDKSGYGVSNSIIHITLNHIPSDSVIPLLTFCVKTLSQNPRRAKIIVPWIRGLLLTKKTFFVNSKELHQAPEGLLYKLGLLLERRTQSFPKMLQLSGRLDMMMYNLNRSKSKALISLAAQARQISEDNSESRMDLSEEMSDTED